MLLSPCKTLYTYQVIVRTWFWTITKFIPKICGFFRPKNPKGWNHDWSNPPSQRLIWVFEGLIKGNQWLISHPTVSPPLEVFETTTWGFSWPRFSWPLERWRPWSCFCIEIYGVFPLSFFFVFFSKNMCIYNMNIYIYKHMYIYIYILGNRGIC